MIGLRVQRSAASLAQVDAALAQLDSQAGIYFGVDAGIAGLHPLQATLLVEPALALRLYGDGLEVEALTGFGQAVRGPRMSGIAALRTFLACFDPSPNVLLLGALPFAAHRLADPGNDAGALGVLFFGQHLLRRDGAGAWQHVALSLPGPLLPASPPAAPIAAQADPDPVATEPRDDFPVGAYADMVRRALDCLRERPLVSLTLSQSYRRRVQLPAVTAFGRLREASPRGWYGGLMVQVASNGDALAGTILRAAAVRGGVAEVRTGGDLMADSSPEREEQESRLKTLSLWRAFGLESAAARAAAPQDVALPAAVHLVDAGDPFGNAMRDCLLGLGLHLTAQAPCALLVGTGKLAACPEQHLLAVGDAALAHAGRRVVCLLFRPDSMLSSPQALQLLRAALAFAAEPLATG